MHRIKRIRMKKLIIVAIVFSMFLSCKDEKVTHKSKIHTQTYEQKITLTRGLDKVLDAVKIQSKVVPILRGKEDNIVLSWEFQVKNAMGKTIILSFRGNFK